MNLLIIGAGKMATALGHGIAKHCKDRFTQITACDPNEHARAAFTQTTGLQCVEAATPELTAAADLIILAVKPQVAASACVALPPRKADVIILSICAGISIDKIKEWLHSDRIIRVMPNTPLLVGFGASCFVLADANDAQCRENAIAILSPSGKVWQIDEAQMDAVTALSGSGPAYFFAFIEALRDGGVKLGLDATQAQELAIQTMRGACEMLIAGCGTPEQLREAVTSKGGTTAAALDVMAKDDFAGLVAKLMRAASDRSKELGK